MTLKQFEILAETRQLQVPIATAWLVEGLGEARGRQELFARQAPQKLNALRESAIIESAISSNRIEGVEIAASRRSAVLSGRGRLRDRDEAEVRGYRDALRLIHEEPQAVELSEETVLRLHKLARADSGDAEEYKQQDNNLSGTQTAGRGAASEPCQPLRHPLQPGR